MFQLQLRHRHNSASDLVLSTRVGKYLERIWTYRNVISKCRVSPGKRQRRRTMFILKDVPDSTRYQNINSSSWLQWRQQRAASGCATPGLWCVQFSVTEIISTTKISMENSCFKINRVNLLNSCKLKSSQLTTEKCKRPRKGGNLSAGKKLSPNYFSLKWGWLWHIEELCRTTSGSSVQWHLSSCDPWGSVYQEYHFL